MVEGGGATDGTVYHRKPHRLSEPTNSLSHVTGSGSVPSTQPPCGSSNPEIGTREKVPSQKGRGKNLFLSYQKFTFCINTSVASLSRYTKQGPHLKNNPTPSLPSLYHSFTLWRRIHSCLTGIETSLVNESEPSCV